MWRTPRRSVMRTSWQRTIPMTMRSKCSRYQSLYQILRKSHHPNPRLYHHFRRKPCTKWSRPSNSMVSSSALITPTTCTCRMIPAYMYKRVHVFINIYVHTYTCTCILYYIDTSCLHIHLPCQPSPSIYMYGPPDIYIEGLIYISTSYIYPPQVQ